MDWANPIEGTIARKYEAVIYFLQTLSKMEGADNFFTSHIDAENFSFLENWAKPAGLELKDIKPTL